MQPKAKILRQRAPGFAPASRAAAPVAPASAEALTAGLTGALTQALALHRAGRLSDAETIYRRILAVQPDDFDSLHLLGVIFFQRGDPAQAVRHIDRALAIVPGNSFALNNRGNALKALGRLAEALASYDRAIAGQPDYAEAHCNRGVTLAALDRFAEALSSYDRALALRPDYVEARCNRGAVLHELNRCDEALSSYDRALLLRPDYAPAHSNRGNTLCELKRYDEALSSYDRALLLRPDFAEALTNRGNAFHALKRYDAALADHDRALLLRPDHAEAHSNRGNALHELRRFAEALESFDRALLLRPDYVKAHYNRGNALKELQSFDAALSSYDRALALQPDYAEAHCNRGVALHDIKRFDAALSSYASAVALRPDYADAHFNAAICRLLTGDFERGWAAHEWRWQTANLRNSKRNFPQKPWLGGEDIAGKTVLLHAEQGFGDTIQFCRYAARVAERGARAIVEVQKPLHQLMRALPGAAQIVAKGEALPDFDLHCPLLSLPLAFATRLDTIPGDTPYLRAAAPATTAWSTRLPAGTRPRIGLAWSGRAAHNNDRNRSIALAAFLPLLDVEATFISLQREVRPGDAALLQDRRELAHFGAELRDFSDTAALIANLDLVIAVDTAVAHLAGALAKPVWVLLPFVPDWRWLCDRDESPWYPTARLFRQDETRDWTSVVARVAAALPDFLRGL